MTESEARRRAARLKSLEAVQRRLTVAEDKATELAAERGLALLAASDAGASRAELAKATGLSQARITQVLREARRRFAILNTIVT